MGRPPKVRLRTLNEDERDYLEMLSRAQSAPSVQVIRAKLLLAVADGLSYLEAARSVGRKDGDAVSRLVRRFNEEGLDALIPKHGGGPPTIYGSEERERALSISPEIRQGVGERSDVLWDAGLMASF